MAPGCQDALGCVFRLNCLAHLHDRGLAVMKAVKLHPQKALCQERPESVGARLPKLGARQKEAKGGAGADRLVLLLLDGEGRSPDTVTRGTSSR